MEYVKIFHLFSFSFFAMLTQHIQLHHGFNSTSNTTKQNPNVHLLHAPSKLRLTSWKYHNINSCKQLFKKITEIQTSSMMYLWPYYYLKLFPHKTTTLVIISAHVKHFHCGYLQHVTLQMLLKMVSSNREAHLTLMQEILWHIVV